MGAQQVPRLQLGASSAATSGRSRSRCGTLRVIGCAAVLVLFAAGAQAATGAGKTKAFDIPFTVCAGKSQMCPPVRSLTSLVSYTDVTVAFMAGGNHCSSVALLLFVDGKRTATTPFTGPSGTASVSVPWPEDGKSHSLSYEAEGEAGGCNSGVLVSWDGMITVSWDPQAKTSTTLKCLSSTQPIPAACVVTVKDLSRKPTPPTGNVATSVKIVANGLGLVSPSCTLLPTPADTSSSTCTVEWQPGGEMTRQVQYSISASYGGDDSHASSFGVGSFTLSPAVPPPSWSSKAGKDILKNSGDYLALGAKTAAVPFVAAKIPGATNVPAWFAKGAAIELTVATFAGLELASNVDKAYADYVDPFDPRYKVVAVPHPRRVPTVTVKGSHDRLMESSFLNTLEQELAVTTVLGTTENRAASAEGVGDNPAYQA